MHSHSLAVGAEAAPRGVVVVEEMLALSNVATILTV